MDYNTIWSLINKFELSKRAMAKITGMSSQGFNTMMENKTMTVSVLEIIAHHFNLPVGYFFDKNDGPPFDCLPTTVELSCAKCMEKERQLMELCTEIKNREYTITVQQKLISEYEEKLGKNCKAHCG